MVLILEIIMHLSHYPRLHFAHLLQAGKDLIFQLDILCRAFENQPNCLCLFWISTRVIEEAKGRFPSFRYIISKACWYCEESGDFI